jgi:hypothetical protein
MLVPASLALCQNWTAAEIPCRVLNIQQVVSSPDHSRTYYAGAVSLDSTNNWAATNSIMRYTDGGWSTYGVIPSVVYTVIEFQDTLLAAGSHYLMDLTLGDDTTCVVFWGGDAWYPYAAFPDGLVRKLRVLDNTLYAIGYLPMVNGAPASGIARRVGGVWEPVGQPMPDPNGILQDVVKYDGHLVAIGIAEIGGDRGVYRLENDVWSVMGGGVQGGLCSAQCIAVYNGELYVAGQITMACGNPAQGIMRWDGSAWQPLGTGLQVALGDNSSFATASVMVVHDSLLWVGGGFRFAGGTEANGLATWDGTQWCGIPGTFYGVPGHTGLYRMAFHHDTLFVSANMVDGDSVNHAAKFIGDSYAGPCTGPLSVVEVPLTGLIVTPNPATSTLFVRWPDGRERSIEVCDVHGRVLYRGGIAPTGLSVALWPRGLYIVRSADAPSMRFVLE